MEGTLAEAWTVEGYVMERELPAVLPSQSFTVDLEVAVERELTAAATAVLGLVVAGVRDPEELTRLLGLEDGRLAAMCITDLARRSAVARNEGGIVATEVGAVLWRTRRSTSVERATETLHYDPVRARFEWKGPWEIRGGARGTVRLPLLKELANRDVERALPRLQALVRNRGVPSIDREDKRAKAEQSRRELRALRVLASAMCWREIRLEVWRHEGTAHERLRVCMGAAEDREATERYQAYRFDSRGARVVEGS